MILFFGSSLNSYSSPVPKINSSEQSTPKFGALCDGRGFGGWFKRGKGRGEFMVAAIKRVYFLLLAAHLFPKDPLPRVKNKETYPPLNWLLSAMGAVSGSGLKDGSRGVSSKGLKINNNYFLLFATHLFC